MGSRGVFRGSEAAAREASSGGSRGHLLQPALLGTHTFFFNLPEWVPLEVAGLGRRASPSRLSLAPRWGHSRVAGCSWSR